MTAIKATSAGGGMAAAAKNLLDLMSKSSNKASGVKKSGARGRPDQSGGSPRDQKTKVENNRNRSANNDRKVSDTSAQNPSNANVDSVNKRQVRRRYEVPASIGSAFGNSTNTTDSKPKTESGGTPHVFRASDAPKANAQRTETIHRFDGQTHQANNGFMGFGARKDNTHKLVQTEVKLDKPNAKGETSEWQVRVQPINSGRVNADIVAYRSNQRVTADDFNDNNSALSRNVNNSVKQLNADSNRLPEVKTSEPVKPVQQAHRSFESAVKQQLKNVAGGLSNMVTQTGGTVASVPEKAVKFGASVGDLGKGIVNTATFGHVFKEAYNPIHLDKQNKNYYDKPTIAEQGASGLQNEINRRIGANSNSLAYKVADVLAPLAVGRAKGGAGNGTKVNLAMKEFKVGETVSTVGKKVTTVTNPTNGSKLPRVSQEVTAKYDVVKTQVKPNGSLSLTKNGRAMTRSDLGHAMDQGRLSTADLAKANLNPKQIRNILRDVVAKRPNEQSPFTGDRNLVNNTRFPKRDLTLKEINAAVSKGVIPFKINPGHRTNPARQDNCLNCAQATDATLAGRPASALPSRPKQDNTFNETRDFPNSNMQWRLPVADSESVRRMVKNMKLEPGTKGTVDVSRPNKADGTPQDGHIFNYRIRDNGSVQFIDSQTGGRARPDGAFKGEYDRMWFTKMDPRR